MNGKELKEKLQAAGINLAELSRRMGYKTDQNLHSVLGAKEMSSGVIERMAEATGKPISWFYGKGEAPAPMSERRTRTATRARNPYTISMVISSPLSAAAFMSL